MDLGKATETRGSDSPEITKHGQGSQTGVLNKATNIWSDVQSTMPSTQLTVSTLDEGTVKTAAKTGLS